MTIDYSDYRHMLCSQGELVQILTLTFTSYITLDKLVNLSRPQFPQSFFQIKSEKLQESPGTKTITTVWGFKAILGSQPWPVEIDNFFQMGKLEEVNIFMQSRTSQKARFMF